MQERLHRLRNVSPYTWIFGPEHGREVQCVAAQCGRTLHAHVMMSRALLKYVHEIARPVKAQWASALGEWHANACLGRDACCDGTYIQANAVCVRVQRQRVECRELVQFGVPYPIQVSGNLAMRIILVPGLMGSAPLVQEVNKM